MFRPFLLVGLGGSGGKTLRFVKRDVAKRLRDAGWRDGEIPEAWQFLHIDTPTIQDGMELNSIVDPLDNDEYLGLLEAVSVSATSLTNSIPPRIWIMTWWDGVSTQPD